MTIFIKNGLIVDGTGDKSYKGNILIEKDRITKIGDFDASDATTIIDAEGLVVAPGFIDTHSHSDLDVLVKPEVLPKIMQGVTTEFWGKMEYPWLRFR